MELYRSGDISKVFQYEGKTLWKKKKKSTQAKTKCVVTSNRPSMTTGIREVKTKPRKKQQRQLQGNNLDIFFNV